jgi:CDP-diacylglycerol--glycerol-3-phosphate 3-phosphatidyltransferase
MPVRFAIAFLLFVLAAVTDALDGEIARKRQLVTAFGKLADPLADKLLVLSTIVYLMRYIDLSEAALVVILAREFLVTGLRLVAKDSDENLGAQWFGKAKTCAQIVAISALFFVPMLPEWYRHTAVGLYYVSVVITAISGAMYFKSYWKYIEDM